MTLPLAEPGLVDGWLRRLDARWKLAAVTLAGILIVVLHEPLPILSAVAAALALDGSTGLGPRALARRIAPVAGMLLLLFGWTIFFPRPEEEAWRLGPLTLSPLGAVWLIRVVGKTVALLLLLLAVLETTPMAELGHAAAALHVPGPLVQLFLMTQRYVFLLLEEFSRLRIAVRVRAFRSRVNRHCYRTIGHIAGTLLVRSYDRAERVHQAMACRGFAGTFRTLNAARTGVAEVAFLLVLVVGAAGLVVWDRGWWPA
jgi:cobalt/nickel transport system permease protein